MEKRTGEKHRVKPKKVLGEGRHRYRVVVARTLYQELIVEATSQDEAEDAAYNLAADTLRSCPRWLEEETYVRDCTSVEMADGTWEFCNAVAEQGDTEQGDGQQRQTKGASK